MYQLIGQLVKRKSIFNLKHKCLPVLFVLSMVFTLGQGELSAQRNYYFTEQWSVGLAAGATTFYGDLSNRTNGLFANTPFSKFFYQDRQAMAVLVLDKEFNIYFGVRGHVAYGKLKSTYEASKEYFKANMFEYSLAATLDFTNLFMGADRFRQWSIYGYLGIGLTESRTWKYNMLTGDLVGTNGFGKPKREGGKYVPMTETVLPMGLGFSYQFVKEFSVFVEMAYHPLYTDKLDATVIGSKRDGYGLLMLGAKYHFTMPDHWQIGGRYPRYNGKSNDPAIKKYNKRRRVIMNTKGYKKGVKNRKRFKTTRRKKLRW